MFCRLMNWIFSFSIPKMFFSPRSLNSLDSSRANILLVSAAVNCFIPVRQEAGLFKPRKDVWTHGAGTLSLFVKPSPLSAGMWLCQDDRGAFPHT